MDIAGDYHSLQRNETAVPDSRVSPLKATLVPWASETAKLLSPKKLADQPGCEALPESPLSASPFASCMRRYRRKCVGPDALSTRLQARRLHGSRHPRLDRETINGAGEWPDSRLS